MMSQRANVQEATVNLGLKVVVVAILLTEVEATKCIMFVNSHLELQRYLQQAKQVEQKDLEDQL
jgi:hypothetical protein